MTGDKKLGAVIEEREEKVRNASEWLWPRCGGRKSCSWVVCCMTDAFRYRPTHSS